jgi:hypothetical protein
MNNKKGEIVKKNEKLDFSLGGGFLKKFQLLLLVKNRISTFVSFIM